MKTSANVPPIEANAHITLKGFLNNLSGHTKELEEIVRDIRFNTRMHFLYKEYLNDPFQINSDGTKRFRVCEFNNPETNLLDIFSNAADVKERLRGKLYDLHLANTGEFLAPVYSGPRIILYPDTNVLLDKGARSILSVLGSSPAIEQSELPIIRLEKRDGGVKRAYGKSISSALDRLQQNLEQVCHHSIPHYLKELSILYNITDEYFRKEDSETVTLVAEYPAEGALDVAKRFLMANEHRRNYENYLRYVQKIVETHKKGNFNNGIADRVLAATCFGLNLSNEREKSIVVSNDRDLITLFDIFYNEILPKYMAKIIIDTFESPRGSEQHESSPFQKVSALARRVRKIYGTLSRYQQKIESSCREHIEWARDSGSERVSIGILYVPSENKFYVKEAAKEFLEFFKSVKEYREGKASMVLLQALRGCGPQQALRYLTKIADQHSNPS